MKTSLYDNITRIEYCDTLNFITLMKALLIHHLLLLMIHFPYAAESLSKNLYR